MHDIDIFYKTHAENLFRYKWSHCGWWETQPGYHRWVISFWLFEQRIYCFRKNRNSVKSNKYLFVFILVQLLHIRNYVNGSHFFAFTELFSFFFSLSSSTWQVCIGMWALGIHMIIIELTIQIVLSKQNSWQIVYHIFLV